MADLTTLNDPRQGRGYKPPVPTVGGGQGMRGVDSSSTLGQALGTTKTPFSSALGRKVNAPVAPVTPVAAAAPAAAAELAPTSTAKDNLLNYDELKNMSNDELSARAYKLSQSQNPDDVENAAILVGLQKSKAEKEYGDLQTKKEVETARKTAENALDNANKQRTLFDKQKEILDGEYGHFAPTRETATDIMGLFSMLSIAAMGAGNTGKYYGMNAMAALSGAMKGYKEGRDDVYKKEMTEYEKNLAAFNKHQENLLKGVQLAREMQSIDKDAAAAQFAAVIAQDTGGMGALKGRIGDYASQQKIYETNAKIRREMKKAEEELQRKKDESALRDKEKKEDQRIREDRNAELEREAGARESRLLAALTQKTADKQSKNEIAAGGQDMALIENYGFPKNEVARLSPTKTLPAAVATVYSAEQTKKLANDIKNNQDAAGLALSFLSKVDKYLPSRYDSSSSESGVSLLFNQADTQITGDNPDVVSKARQIAKDAVDVINARALAASGGSRVLVSELRMQKDVIGLENMSPKSAVDVFDRLAIKDMESLKKFGFSQKTLDDAKKRILVTSAPAGGATDKLPPNPDRHFIGTDPIIPNKDNTGWIYEKTGKAVK